jgi:hypothetical protein
MIPSRARRRARILAARSLRLARTHCLTLVSVAVLTAAGLLALTSDAFRSEGPAQDTARALAATAPYRADPALQQNIGLAWIPPSDASDLDGVAAYFRRAASHRGTADPQYDEGLGGMPPLNAIDPAKAAAYFQAAAGLRPQN